MSYSGIVFQPRYADSGSHRCVGHNMYIGESQALIRTVPKAGLLEAILVIFGGRAFIF